MTFARIVDLLRDRQAYSQTDGFHTVRGWVRTKREGKGIAFLELNDGSSLQGLQIVVPQTLNGYDSLLKQITTGTSLEVTGNLVESAGKGQTVEMQATAIAIFGIADPETYPLQKKRHSIEFLRTIAHLRPRTNMFGAVFRVRNACAFAVHKFFQERGF
ncbi:MAG: OB-fold nucleic acid binding domain-containing protein, partial [Pseudanabaena sp.]